MMQNKKENILAFFFYALLSICVVRWFVPGHYILGGDLSWPLSFRTFFRYTTSIWDNSVNTGYLASRQLASLYPYAVWGLILEFMHIPGPLIQWILYSISFVISGFGMFLLSRTLGIRTPGAVVAGLAYMMSPYAAAVAWVPSYGTTFPFYAFLPLSLYFFLWIFNDATPQVITVLKSALLMSIVCFTGASYSNPAFFVLLLFFTSYFFVVHWHGLNYQLRWLQQYTLFVILILLLNAFWLVPFALNIRSEFQSAGNATAGLVSDIDTMKLNSVSISDAFRSTGFWALQGEVARDYYYQWHNFALSPWYTLATFVLPLFALWPFIRKRHWRVIPIAFLILFVGGIVLNAGLKTSGPLEHIVHGLFSNGLVGRMYRAIYLKLGIVLAFALSGLVGYGTDVIAELAAKAQWAVGITVSAVILTSSGLPFLSGDLIVSPGAHGYLAGQRVAPPAEYDAIGQYDQGQALESRYFSLPIPPSYNLALRWSPDNGYNGSDFLRFYLNKPLIYQNNGNPLIEKIIEKINQHDPNYDRWLRLLSVHAVIIHKDLNPRIHDYYVTKSMALPARAIRVLSNQYLNLYTLPDKEFLPLLSVPTSVQRPTSMNAVLDSDLDSFARAAFFTKEDNRDKREMLSALPLETHDPPLLQFARVSPTAYRVRLEGATGTVPIVFSETYHPGWEIIPLPVTTTTTGPGSGFISQPLSGTVQNDRLNNGIALISWMETPALDEAHHAVVNGYANGWLFPVSDFCQRAPSSCQPGGNGKWNVDFLIEFAPQRTFLLGLAISIVTGIVCFVFLLIILWRHSPHE